MAGYSRADRSQARSDRSRSNSPGPAAYPATIVWCDNSAMRFFNTSGPVVAAKHYCIPPLERLDLHGVLQLVGRERYFVLHAPRQTGKTSVLLALKDELNRSGDYRCVYINVEVGQAAGEDVGAATRSILNHTARRAQSTLNNDFVANIWPEALSRAGPYNALEEVLGRWAEADPRPLVLLIDEIDSLIGDTLLAVLRQLRAGYDQRPTGFPQSVVLCGVRDVRDYRIHSATEKALVTGGSAFNIKSESLRLGDFSRHDVETLLAQHTGETGQVFDPDAGEAIWTLTQGQPWLVNALAYQACFRSEDLEQDRPVTAGVIRDAAEELVLRRDTHLDQLADKLREERVRRVVEPVLSGETPAGGMPDDDVDYVRDLGLIARDGPIRIANPIYREIVPRQLVYGDQDFLSQETAWYVDLRSGRLRTDKLLAAFQTFFREHSEHWLERYQYREAGPQLLLQAFLQRIVNSGGRIEREYGLGRMRTDLLVVWPGAPTGPGTDSQRIVIECKVRHGSLEGTVAAGLKQTRAYMDRCAAEEGHLIVFDRSSRPWRDKVFRCEETEAGAMVTIWGM